MVAAAVGQETDLTLTAGYRFVDDMIEGFDTPFDPVLTVPAHDVLDLSATVARGPWRVQLYADNVGDEYIIRRKWFNWFFSQTPSPRVWNTVAPPRTVGVRLGYEF